MVAGDFVSGVPSSVYQGVYGVFLVTNFWDPSSMGKEYEQSVPVIDAAFEAGVKQFVFSSLANSLQESNGKYSVDHFSTKAKIENYIRSKGFQYTAFPAAGFYYSNFQSYFPARPDENGNFTVTMPISTRIAAGDVNQIGGVVAAVFADPAKYNGLFIAFAGEEQPPEYFVNAMSAKSGKKITLNQVPIEVFASFGFPGAHELAEMFSWMNEYGYFGSHDTFAGRNIDPTLRTFPQWLDHINYSL